MTAFRPTLPPPGRLVRLGVVLDTRNAPPRLGEIARMCDRARLDAVWVGDHLAAPDGEPRLEAWTALTLAGRETSRVHLGAMLNVAFRPPATLAAMAGTLDRACVGRVEIGLSAGRVEGEHVSFGFDFPDPEVRTRRLERYAVILKGLMAGETVEVTGGEGMGGAAIGMASPQPGGPRLSVEAATPGQIEVAARVADDLLVPAVEHQEGAVGRIRQAVERAGRDPATIGIALEVPLSIGRTRAEAQARADAEPLFSAIGHPAEVGIFGTLEECQNRVIELAHAGVTDLRCILPNAPDVHDVIAQLTAMVVGSTDVLVPNSPRSKPPDPPEGWGGRARKDASSGI